MTRLGEPRAFGALPDGTRVDAVRIGAGAIEAEILTWGAVVRDIRLAMIGHPLVLGFDALDAYLRHPGTYFGATAGRYANRIAEGRFKLDGETYQLDRNFRDRHHLHGGEVSFAWRPWRLEDSGEDFVTLSLSSPDAEGGYPGRVDATATFRTVAEGTLRVDYQAAVDAPTIVNLAHHSYFNLDGRADVLEHTLQIDAQAYLPVDELLIPTGEIRPVEGTPFDFRHSKRIGEGTVDYDHNFCLDHTAVTAPAFAARAVGADARVGMEVWTTEPGLQFYDGALLAVPVPGLQGRRYGRNAGFCLEPQRWPDSPNRPEFTVATVRPEENYKQRTEYRFERG